MLRDTELARAETPQEDRLISPAAHVAINVALSSVAALGGRIGLPKVVRAVAGGAVALQAARSLAGFANEIGADYPAPDPDRSSTAFDTRWKL